MEQENKIQDRMLVEKYRPHEFYEVVGIDPAIEKLLHNLPHLLFVGPAGTGKTTTAKIVIDKLNADALILNASDERGIDTIRDRVKNFVMNASVEGRVRVVFLDEADSLTNQAQDILRNMMETYSATCRFILTGNYDNKISEAIQSRCTKFAFKLPDKTGIKERLKYVCGKEDILISEDALDKIIEDHYPDIRSCVKTLQTLSTLKKVIEIADITSEDEFFPKLIEALKEGKFNATRQIAVDSYMDPDDLVKKLYDFFITNKDYPAEFRMRVIDIISEQEWKMKMSSHPVIQFERCLLDLVRLIKETK